MKTLPHDGRDFTQGLVYHQNRLYESTGQYGRSSLKAVDPQNGAVLQRVRLPATHFGEGIALAEDRIWQLTWREEEALIYTLPDLKNESVVPYRGEGWGLAWDGRRFHMSNGSDTLYIRDDRFRIVGHKAVRLEGRPLTRLNELEYARGRIFANVWYSDSIAVIDPLSGRVAALVDCSALALGWEKRKPEDVLNGIAYDPESEVFFLTGKNWPTIHVVEIDIP